MKSEQPESKKVTADDVLASTGGFGIKSYFK